jgi:nucleoside-diphosphate-sugar epimerase
MAKRLVSQRIAVTGATGFIGMHVLRRLHAAGAVVIAIVEIDKHLERLGSLPFSVERIVMKDVCELGDAVRSAKADYVIHLSAFVANFPHACDYAKLSETYTSPEAKY